MDRRVTVRFFRVEGVDGTVPEFRDVLKEISEIVSPEERIRNSNFETAEEVKVRLERLSVDGDFVSGEFTRLQTDNIPPEVGKDGLKPIVLSDGIGLGHVAAFRYHSPTKVLALQHNSRSVSHKSVVNYLMSYDDVAKYIMSVVVRRDVWDKFAASEPRSFEIAVASPQNLHVLENENDVVVDAFQNFGAAMDGFVITLGARVSRKQDDKLNKNKIREYINLFLGLRERNSAEVKTLKVVTDQRNDAGAYDSINFLREYLVERTSLDLPSDDDERNYELRSEWIKTKMNDNLDYLTEIFV